MSQKTSPNPPNGRLISAGLTAAAAFGLLVNHFLIDSQHVGRLMILCLGPIAFFLGIGGIVEPKIVWSVGKYGKQLPAIYKVIGGMLGTVGLAVTGLLLLFVYQLGPSEPKPSPRRPGPAATAARLRTRTDSTRQPVNAANSEPAPTENPERRIVARDVQYLTYDRPGKRWVPMDETALKGVKREDREGVTTLHYTDGTHALLKVVWPDVLEIGDRFTVELQGVNSIEVVDLDGPDAHARIGGPAGEAFTVVEVHRQQDGLTFVCDGQPQMPYYASAKLRGDDARAALVSSQLKPAFTVKKGAHASFRNAGLRRTDRK
ncbi:MAG: hypothetical protein ACYTGL_03870 [Planctomycetota bacterium]|jgi:hypothetical protein